MTRQRFGTVTRVVSRALLVAGFAGGAWLLSSAAAHAAAPERTDPVRIDSLRADQAVVNLTTPVTRTATDLLHVVLPTAPRHHTAVQNKAAASQAETVQRPTAALLRTIPSVLHALRPLTGAVGLGTGPLADLLAPVNGGPRTTLVPVAGHAEAVRQHVAPAKVGPVGAARAATHPRRTSVVAFPTTVRGTDTGQTPARPERAPVPAYPGPGNTGISTTASGSHLDGGACAAAAPVPGGPMADRRGLVATEVPVRLLLAEAPIFAPD